MTTHHVTDTARRPIHRPLLIACLLAAPALLAASELARLRVESAHVESEDAVADARSQLDAVAAQLPLWHLAAVLDYVASGAYRGEPSFQRFLQKRADALRAAGQPVDLWK